MHADNDVERRQRLVAGIERNVARLIELTTTITKVSGLGMSDDRQPGMQRVSLSTVAREAARQLRDMAQDRHVEIVIAADLPDVTVDVGRLEIIFTNLLSNAIKYSDPAKMHRFVEVSSVDVPNGRCTFQVHDNGLGMAHEQLEQVFTPFYRAHASRDAELGIDGLGLGLSIVRECVEAIDASINVTGELGQGTTFAVTMPSASSHEGRG
jgi:signal transduction histidine kinase